MDQFERERWNLRINPQSDELKISQIWVYLCCIVKLECLSSWNACMHAKKQSACMQACKKSRMHVCRHAKKISSMNLSDIWGGLCSTDPSPTHVYVVQGQIFLILEVFKCICSDCRLSPVFYTTILFSKGYNNSSCRNGHWRIGSERLPEQEQFISMNCASFVGVVDISTLAGLLHPCRIKKEPCPRLKI